MNSKNIFYGTRCFLKKHGPKILGYGGALLNVAAAPLYIRGGKKYYEGLKDVPDDKKSKIKHAVKSYGPAVATHITGTVMSTVGFQKAENRAMSYAAGLAAVSSAYKNYRENIKREYGDEADIKAATVDATTTEPEVEPKPYDAKLSRFISELNPLYDSDHQKVVETVLALQTYFNQINNYREVTLNEIFTKLHFKPEKKFAYIGYPKGYCHIDFGVEDIKKHPDNMLFLNGYENCLWVDFSDAVAVYEDCE